MRNPKFIVLASFLTCATFVALPTFAGLEKGERQRNWENLCGDWKDARKYETST